MATRIHKGQAPIVLDPAFCAIEKHRARKRPATHTVSFLHVRSQKFNVCAKCAPKWIAKRFPVVEIAVQMKEAA